MYEDFEEAFRGMQTEDEMLEDMLGDAGGKGDEGAHGGFRDAMETSIRAAVAAGSLDEDAQAAPVLGALTLASDMDRAFRVDQGKLRLLLDYCKALGVMPSRGGRR